ncbi:DoxX-like family protein [Maribacter sp. 2210JD10-5]|uniref:DoxX-like family protein n=1 Tax=Maribacter sp. 2210JD10-5 TaxID=3386272 RepID=UPI0039BCDB52
MVIKEFHSILTFLIAAVWLINGLVCKVLNLVPRHGQIVGQILGDEFSRPLTLAIGVSEIIMAVWVLSRYKSRLNTMAQMGIVAVMNILEFLLVPDLLLWGKFNSLFALLFIGIVYYNEFILKEKLNRKS